VNVPALLATVVLLLANGFFVAVEFAVIASRRTKIEPLAAEGHPSARRALRQVQSLNLQLTGAQLGITMASLLLGFVAEPALADLIESTIGGVVDLPDGALHAISFTLALAIVVFLHMVVGEMVPKNLAIAQPERTLLALSLPNAAYVAVTRPVLWLLNRIANAGVRRLGVEPRDELATVHSAEELQSMLADSRREGLIEDLVHQLLAGALTLPDRPVRSVMVGRDRIAWIDGSATPAEAEAQMARTGRTRLLVCDRDLDDVRGFVHAKDLLPLTGDARHRPLPLGRVRRMLRVAPSDRVVATMVAMQRARVHVALVTGDGGKTLGLASLEDLLEALVGDIRDESDPAAAP
jgi:CBS domain containing-hemolysin-like protein